MLTYYVEMRLLFNILMTFYLLYFGIANECCVDSGNQLFKAIESCEFDSSIIYHGSQHILVGFKYEGLILPSLSCKTFLLRISFSVDELLDCSEVIVDETVVKNSSSIQSPTFCEPISTCWLDRPMVFKDVSWSLQFPVDRCDNKFTSQLLELILQNINEKEKKDDISIRLRKSKLTEFLFGGRIQSIAGLVFDVNTPILMGSYSLPTNSIRSNKSSCNFGAQYFDFELVSRFDGSVSNLNKMSKYELMHYIFGYFTDLLTMSRQLNQFPVDAHPGNQLYSKPLNDDMKFYWSDFGASSSGKSSSFANVTTIKHASKMYVGAFENFYRKVSKIASELNWASVQTLLVKIKSIHKNVSISTNAVDHFIRVLRLIYEFIDAESRQDPEMVKSLCLRVNPTVGFFVNRLSDNIASQDVLIASQNGTIVSLGAEIHYLKSKFASQDAQIANLQDIVTKLLAERTNSDEL